MDSPRRRKLRAFVPREDPVEQRRQLALQQLRSLDTRPQIFQRRQERAVRILQRLAARPKVQTFVRKVVERRARITRLTLAELYRPEPIIRRLFNENWTTPFTVRIRFPGGNIAAERIFNYQGISKNKAYEDFRQFFIEYDEEIYKYAEDNDIGDILIYPYARIQPQLQNQAYREGEEHCFFTPLIALWSQPCKTASTQKEHDQILKRIKKLADEYGDKPVPHDDVPAIAKKCNTTIKIFDPLGNELHSFNPSARKLLCLRHTRNNHVESTHENRDVREITYDEGQELLQTENDYVVEGNYTDPTKIHTNTEILHIINPMKPYLDEIRNAIPDIKFNATQHPTINEYILQSRIINSSTLCFNPDYDQHYDLEKAYTQFHTTQFYQGFLGVIHQWRSFQFAPTQAFLDSHIGIYKARITTPSKLATMLGMNKGDHLILPSPEWKFHKKTGTEFVILSGVYGSKFDFRFPASALETVKTRQGTSANTTGKTASTENKPFRMFAGQCSAKVNEFDKKRFAFKTTKEFAGHLACLYKEVDYNENLGVAVISVPFKTVFTNHHFLSFITSYTRIVMMEQMLKLPTENIAAITLDGLYFKGKPSSPFISCFRPKQPKIVNPVGDNKWYVPVQINEQFPPMTPYNQNSALLGAGGTGKTHAILTDRGFNTILYVSPTHELGKAKEQEFGVHYTTLHRAIGEQCRSYKESYGTPAVIFVDELTQMEASFVDRLIALYPESLIFVAGDIDETGKHYQCKYTNEIWKPTFKTFTFTTDYRSNTQELKQSKVSLRSFMKTNPTADDVKEYAKATFTHIPWVDAVLDFKTDTDIWIAGTHKYINKHPFKVHTTHSYQGKTIEQPKRLFISTDDLFEATMFYTAMSRVRHHDQLVFVLGSPTSKDYLQRQLDLLEDGEEPDDYLKELAFLYTLTPFHKSAGPDVLNDEANEECGRCKKQRNGFLYTNGTDEYHICKSCIPYE